MLPILESGHKDFNKVRRLIASGLVHTPDTGIPVLSISFFVVGPIARHYNRQKKNQKLKLWLVPILKSNMHIMYLMPNGWVIKYKEGNNHPSSINQISLVHNHDKAGNECYNMNTRETQVCE